MRSLIEDVKGRILGKKTSESKLAPAWRIFDREYYLLRNPDVAASGMDPCEHYQLYGWRERRNPHPMFNTEYYLTQVSNQFSGEVDPLTHYESEGYRYASAHPLFDRSYYLEQSPELGSRADALSDYLFGPERHKKNPHKLFDTVFYLSQVPELEGTNECPLAHYLESGHTKKRRPNYLFDPDFLLSQLPEPLEQRTPLERFIVEDAAQWAYPCIPFDPKVYSSRLRALGGAAARIDRSSDLLAYYLTSGWREDVSPCAYFDFRFYRDEIGGQVVDPFYHYLCCEGYRKFSFNPGLDLSYYRAKFSELISGRITPLEHLLAHIDDADFQPHPFLDLEWYLSANRDVREANVPAAKHFITAGINEPQRRPNPLFSESFVWDHHREHSFTDETAHSYYFRKKLHCRQRLVFVGHDASRTGAPLILLRLIQEIAASNEIEPLLFLMRGGELLDEFRKCAHTHVIGWGEGVSDCLEVGQNDERIRREITRILSVTDHNRPLVAFCNTIETVAVAKILKDLDIPVISLVHEMAWQYSVQVVRDIASHSRTLVFPSDSAKHAALSRIQLTDVKVHAEPQGLLRDNFGISSREKARQNFRRRLGVSDDALIVLGCGTVDLRKGFDLFCDVASRVCGSSKTQHDVPVFVWVGGKMPMAQGDREPFHDGSWWAQHALLVQGHSDAVVHIETQEDMEECFLGADVFFLASRADPCPNVVFEAMACSVPVVYFKSAGGAEEVIADESGIGVPYADTAGATVVVNKLLESAELRNSFGKKGRAKVRADYRFADYARRILNIGSAASGKSIAIPLITNVSPRKKIYFLSADWIISGVNTFTEALVRRLNEMGYDASILFTAGRFTRMPPDEKFLPDVPKVFLQPSASGHRAVWKRLTEFFKDHEPCIVVPNHDFAGGSVVPLFPDHVGVVCIAHSDDGDHYEQSYRLGRWSNKLVTVSEYIRRRLVEMNETFADKARAIHYGVEPGEISDAALWAKKFDDSNPLTLVYSGRFVSEQKRIERYVKLATILAQRGVNFRMLLVGDGPKMDWVRESLESLISAGRVELTGRLSRSEIDSVLERAHVFLLLSEYEGLPLALLEAMSRGCVTVAMNIASGVPDVIDHDENGFLSPQGDIHNVADFVEQLDKDREKLELMCKQARATFFSKKLSAQDMANNYAEVFEEVFSQIKSGSYRRPLSHGHRVAVRGVMPPPWLN